MPEPILIKYKTQGIPEVSAAFDTIERRIIALTQSTAANANVRMRAVKAEAESMTVAKTAEQKAADKAEDAKTRTVEREARRRQAIVDRSASMAGKFAAQQAKEEEKALAEGTRAVEREQRRRDDIRNRSAAMAGRFAEQQANAEIAAHRRIGTVVGNSALSGTRRVLGGLASYGGMAIGALGAFGLADAVRGRFAAERDAAQIVNAVTSGGVAPKGANVRDIIGAASGVSVQTGMTKDEIIKGSLAYARSARGGDFGGVMGNMGFFAKLAKTTGTDIGELAGAAGKLQSQNPDLARDPKAMQQLLLNAYEMSKSGSVSLADAAAQIGTLASTRGFYQGDTAANQRKLMALGQIAASGGATGDIGTYIKDVSIEVAAKRRHTAKEVGLGGRGVEALGVHFDQFGAMESPEQMIGAIFKATGGDMSKIHGIVGNRGLPLFTELQKSFQQAGGGDKGVAAVQAQIAGVSQATMTPAQLEAQFATVMATTPERFAKAVATLREHIEMQAVPILDKLAAKFDDPAFMANVERVIDGLGSLASFLIANPFLGIGAVVLGAITKDLAAAAIGEAVKSALTRMISGQAPLPAGALGSTGAKVAGGFVGAAIAAEATGAAFSEKTGEEATAKAGVLGLLGKPTSEKDRQAKIAAVQRAIAEGKSENLNSAGNIAADVALPAAKLVNQIAGVVGVNDATTAEEASARRERIKIEQRYNQELEEQLRRLQASRGAAVDQSRISPIGSSNSSLRGIAP
jgi:hypothetical protein